MSYTRIQDNDIKVFITLESLKHLSLNNTSITDDAINFLCRKQKE